MSRPGDRLRVLAARMCREQTMERFIDPVIADLQVEHAAAIRDGRMWKSRWAQLTGYVAFAKVLCLCGLFGSQQAWRNWNGADRQNLARVLWRSGLATLALACLIEMPELRRLPSTLETSPHARSSLLIAYLVPAALGASIPLGLLIGTTLGLAGRVRSRRTQVAVFLVALATSVVCFVNVAWIVPAANQAYREERVGGSIPRGERELFLLELRRAAEVVRQWDAAHPEVFGRERARHATFEYHRRYAFALAPLTLAVFAILLVPHRRLGTLAATTVVCAAVVGGILIWNLGVYLSNVEAVPPPVSAWFLHLVVVTVATFVIINRRWTTLTRTRA